MTRVGSQGHNNIYIYIYIYIYYYYYNCNVIKPSKYLLFVNDITIFRAVNSADDCTLLQPDTERIQDWCNATYMNLQSSKTEVFPFTMKTNVFQYAYKIGDSL